MLISFAIPCYRSEYTIVGVVNEIISVMSQRPDYDYEIVCVNDSSPDHVYGVLRNISKENKKIKVINFAKNFGKHSALLAAYSIVSGDVIVTLDDDGQCPVDHTWELIDALNDDVDISIAEYKKKKENIIKRFGSKVNDSVSKILVPQPASVTFENFSAMKRYVVKETIKYTNPYPMLVPLILQITHKIVNIPMEERERADQRKGGYTFTKSFALMINGFTNFSVMPLRIATIIGMIFAILGFVYATIVVVRRMLFPDIAVGYSSIMAAILFIGGVLMLLLGIIGEYLGRLYVCVNSAPQYVIKDKINVGEE